jgi:hypothetical protein
MPRLRTALPLFTLALLAGSAAPAAAQAPRASEVLIGNFYCNAGDGSAYSGVSFDATSSVLSDTLWVGRNGTVTTGPADFCDASVAVVRAALTSCTLGPIEAYADDQGASRTFQFVCAGSRVAVVSALARASSALLGTAP